MIVRRLTRDERGVAAVEFAITSPVYFLALFGLAQAGLWLWGDFSLQRAANAASRWAAIQCGPKLATCPSASQLQSYAVTNIVGLSVPSNAFSLSTTNPQLQRRPGQRGLWRADLHVRSGTAEHHCARERLLPDLSRRLGDRSGREPARIRVWRGARRTRRASMSERTMGLPAGCGGCGNNLYRTMGGICSRLAGER
jgi:TadE-like protein